MQVTTLFNGKISAHLLIWTLRSQTTYPRLMTLKQHPNNNQSSSSRTKSEWTQEARSMTNKCFNSTVILRPKAKISKATREWLVLPILSILETTLLTSITKLISILHNLKHNNSRLSKMMIRTNFSWHRRGKVAKSKLRLSWAYQRKHGRSNLSVSKKKKWGIRNGWRGLKVEDLDI